MDQHEHAPLAVLNETEILLHHSPDPNSYLNHDYFSSPHSSARGFIILHVLGFLVAYWVLLPLVIAMRIAQTRWRIAMQLLFLFFSMLSLAAASIYNKLTPDFYQGSRHRSFGYILLFLTVLVTLVDAFPQIIALVSHIRNESKLSRRSIWEALLPSNVSFYHSDYLKVVGDDDLESISVNALTECHILPESTTSPQTEAAFQTIDLQAFDSQRTTFEGSVHSDCTLNNFSPISHSTSYDEHHNEPRLTWRDAGHIIFVTVERSLVLLSFALSISGIAIYTGMCRGNYLNGCLAHLIKGGIFWIYGLLTFARFLGVYADIGWAWNYITSSGRLASAEFVESFVIFVYGATNTWMERYGATPGSPFTTKQVQHISIAVMFWFGGLVGMAIESRRIRHWLSSAAVMTVKPGKELMEPRVYGSSFNPLPAIVIGITGAAMSAHHQTYLFQVQIHALWGNFLVGFAVLRCMTYFFLWLCPPQSTLPTRPPTELVASFCLACGGLTFIFSTEQVTFAAMRHGYDDVMMFLNLAVGITCLAFCWTIAVLSMKGWMTLRYRRR